MVNQSLKFTQMSNVNSFGKKFTLWTKHPYEALARDEMRKKTKSSQCKPFPMETCYQAAYKSASNLHSNTFHFIHSFALISPIITANGWMSLQTMKRPITSLRGCSRCQFTPASPFHSVCWFWQLEFPLQSKGLFNWICSWWQNCCSAKEEGGSLTQRLSHSHGKARRE